MYEKMSDSKASNKLKASETIFCHTNARARTIIRVDSRDADGAVVRVPVEVSDRGSVTRVTS